MKIVGILGLGLIGGSIGMILKKYNYKVIGNDHNKKNAEYALKNGIVDEIKSFKDLIKKSSIIILSIPVNGIIKILPIILDKIPINTTILDTGSTKNEICKKILFHPNRKRYVATHPIAGIEKSGPDSANSKLFYNKNCIICDKELSAKDALSMVKKIFSVFMKMQLIYINSKEHDIYISYASHLPHVLSFVLSKTILNKFKNNKKNFYKIIGSGFKSTTRLAKSNPETWTPIFLDNKINLIQSINEYINFLKIFRISLLRKDKNFIFKSLKEANKI